jgi:hypothetical protein
VQWRPWESVGYVIFWRAGRLRQATAVMNMARAKTEVRIVQNKSVEVRRSGGMGRSSGVVIYSPVLYE